LEGRPVFVYESDKYLTPEEIRAKNKRRHRSLRIQGKSLAYGAGYRASTSGHVSPLSLPTLLVTARPRRG
jgi:hypothetical protein